MLAFLLVFGVIVFLLSRTKTKQRPESKIYENIDDIQHSIYSEKNNVTRVSIKTVQRTSKENKTDSINRKSSMIIMENDTYGLNQKTTVRF